MRGLIQLLYVVTFITLAWNPSPTRGILGYFIYDNGNLVETSTTTRVTLDIVRSGKHTFQVRAYNTAGKSLPSNSVTTTVRNK